MSWSVNFGAIAGTVIRIHITFLLFLAWIFIGSYVSGGAEAAWSGLAFTVLLFACVLAHEFGHILVARAFGIPTPDVTLLPIGGVARLERIPEQAGQELLIAVAGPLVNVAIAVVLVLFGGADLTAEHLHSVEDSKIAMVDRLASVNLFLALFNMIPAFPMDGGRVLRALLATRWDHVRATEIAAAIGQAFAFVLGFAGLFVNPMLIFIAIFIYLAAASEAQVTVLRAMSRDVPVKAAMITQFARLQPEATINEAVDTLLHTSQSEFPVVDSAQRPVGLLDRSRLIGGLQALGPDAPVSRVMQPEIPTVSHRSCLDEAFRVLQDKSSPAVGVIDANGSLVGMVTSETVGEMLMLNRALPKGARLGPWSQPG